MVQQRIASGSLAITAICWLASSSASAAGETATTQTDAAAIKPVTSCKALFGDAATRKVNAKRRGKTLMEVEGYDQGVEVVHYVPWIEPRELVYDGLEFHGLEEHDGQPVGVVEVGESIDYPGCEPGRYAVRVDDGLGRGVRVLAVLDNALLIETPRQLGYVASTATTHTPEWRMIWVSDYTIRRKRDAQSGGSNRGLTPPRHTARKAPKKRRKTK